MKKATFIALLSLCVVVSVLYGMRFLSTNTHALENTVLTVGLTSGYPPYEVLSHTGELEGFDIDVAYAIGAKLGKKVVITDMAFDALTMQLQQGKLDLIISGMSITPERLEKLVMVHYQGKPLTELALLFWKTIPEGISQLDDVKKYPDAIVAVQAGTIHESVMKLYPTVKLTYLDVPQMPLDLMYHKSWAALQEVPVAEGLSAKQPDLKVLRVPLPPQMQSLGNGIAIAKKRTELAQQVIRAVEELKQEGIIAKLEKKWFKESPHGV